MAFITGIPIRNSIHSDTASDIGDWKKYRAELTGLYVTGDGTGAMYEQYASQDFREYNEKVNDLGLSGNILMEPMDEGFRFTNNPILGAYTGSVGAFSTRGLGFGGPIMRVRREELPWAGSTRVLAGAVREADVRLDKNGEISFDSPIENLSEWSDWANTHTTGIAGNPVVVRRSTLNSTGCGNRLGDHDAWQSHTPNGINQCYEYKTVDCTWTELETVYATGIKPFVYWAGNERHRNYLSLAQNGSLFDNLPTGRGVLTPFWLELSKHPPITDSDFAVASLYATGGPLTRGISEGYLSGMVAGVAMPDSQGLAAFGLPLSFTWLPNANQAAITWDGSACLWPANNPISTYITSQGGAFTPNSERISVNAWMSAIASQRSRWIIDVKFPDDLTLGGFLGSDCSAYVTTWYDQSATGSAQNNLVQATADKQPKLIESGTFITDTGGNKCLLFDSGDALYFDTGFSSTINLSGLSSFVVFQASGTTSQQLANLGSFSDSNKRWYSPLIDAGNFKYSYGANNPITSASETANTNINLVSLCADTAQGDARGFRNGSHIGGTATLEDKDGGTSLVGLGALAGAAYYGGRIHEFMVFQNQTTSTHRTKIEEDINNHFDIY